MVSTGSTTGGGSVSTGSTTGGALAGIREVSRRFPDSPHGHLEDLRDDPIELLHRVREECGDVGRFRLADRDVVLVSGSTRRRRTRS